MPQVFQISDILWKRNNILLETWNASVSFADVSATPEVANADLHVVQRDEHRLDDGGVLGEVQPLLVRGTDVQTEERVPVVSRGEGRHSVYN